MELIRKKQKGRQKQKGTLCCEAVYVCVCVGVGGPFGFPGELFSGTHTGFYEETEGRPNWRLSLRESDLVVGD